MASADSHKRLKAASGAPISAASSPSPAASLPAYQPPARIVSRDGSSPSRPSVSIARPANGKTSLRLTVKAPPSKLRQATSGSRIPSNPYADTPSESDTTPAPRAARSTRNPRTVVEPDSDDLDEEMNDAEDDEMEEDAEGEIDDDMQDEDESGEEDADGEEDDLDDGMQDDHPPPPVIKQERPPGQSKPNVRVIAPPEGPLKSVEDKEMEDDEEDLSELESNEGEDDEEEEEEEDDDSDEDDENSRSATPDLTKLTKRQRAAFEEFDGGLMALSNEAQKKKHLTAEEHAMRRQEMARRRKNLSEKRNEEEKMDTINKLLKKPAPKRRTRAEILAAQAADASPGAEYGEEEKPDPLYVRWVHGREGSRIGVPEEWIDAPVGEMFRKPGSTSSNRMIEEVV